jgi:hypothetical protein
LNAMAMVGAMMDKDSPTASGKPSWRRSSISSPSGSPVLAAPW